jgi:ABC-type microcin C transport system duplicated ATPase subunit YejF
VAEIEGEAPDQGRHRRGLKFRRRDDYAVELFREAMANLEDLRRIDRILLELGRFYNPYINAPIVDLATRRRVIELLERSQLDEARQILDERLALYSQAPGTED